ncbi:MAG: translation initiation factor IF-2 [bacterium]|nr:translation initiation factor IF-2 [bacterium]
MVKVRVHELAKKLNMSNQDLMTILTKQGMAVKTHSSSIDEAAAMQLISSNSKNETGAASKTRTVLRRRRKEDEVETVEATPEVKAEVVAVAKEEIPEIQISETVNEVKPVIAAKEAEIAVVKETLVEPKVTAKEIVVSAEEKVATQAVPEPASNVKTPGPVSPVNNVVRVIDADAIRARLAGEGRTFRPRKPVSRPPSNSTSGFGGIREIKVVHDSYGGPTQMIDMSSTAKPAARPASKRKTKETYQKEKEKKELKSGGYDLWLQPGRKRKSKKGGGQGTQITQAAAHKRVVELSGPITVNDLAHQMSVKAGQLVAKLMGMGMMVTVNQPIDFDTATIVASEFEYEVKNVFFDEMDLLKEEADKPESLLFRSPVVTVMGHVDHGKTSILDALRKSDVAKGEAGGITQHIGAYTVQTQRGMVTFLDTPGHEAFTSMRARGAQVTDIVILVVAADDGVMPQTIEAIAHAKAAKVPIVVAVNKMDVPNAKPERVLQQLSEHGVVSEEWGGDAQVFKISALKKEGLEELLEGLINQAEMMELKANPDKAAAGCVIEAKLDKGRGPVATVLIQAGTLRTGDNVVAGEFTGRVRAMHDSSGNPLEQAGPSMAVQILGLSGVSMAGDKFNAVADDKLARVIADHRAQKNREQELMKTSRVSLENFLQSNPDDIGHTLRLIVKADVYGSVEAIVAALKGLSTKLVTVDVVHSGVGTITENDINLAFASKAIVIGFNSKPDNKAQALASQEKIDVRAYSVIYAMLDEVKKAMAGMLSPVVEETYLGKAEVRVVFAVSKLGKIAGCMVTDGHILRSANVRVKRAGVELHQGAISNLKRFKDDAKDVTSGYECGLCIAGFDDLKEGDIVECFSTKKVAAKLDEALKNIVKNVDKEENKVESSTL